MAGVKQLTRPVKSMAWQKKPPFTSSMYVARGTLDHMRSIEVAAAGKSSSMLSTAARARRRRDGSPLMQGNIGRIVVLRYLMVGQLNAHSRFGFYFTGTGKTFLASYKKHPR